MQITDPFLNLFRGLLPSLGKIDISPIIGFIILQYAQKFVAGLAGL
jgi:YggT family protein